MNDCNLCKVARYESVGNINGCGFHIQNLFI